MALSAADEACAREISATLVSTGEGLVRQVSVVGSRARGTPRPDSDIDIVVIVELPAAAVPWGTQETVAAQRQMRQRVRTTACPVDLLVRTADQFAEARNVVGGVESLVGHEGVTVYSRPLDRPPTIRRSADTVRRQNARMWLEESWRQLGRALAGEQESIAQGRSADPSRLRVTAHADGAVHRAINVPFVYHKEWMSKHLPVESKLARLCALEPELGRQLGTLLQGSLVTARVAHAVWMAVYEWLSHDPRMTPHLAIIQKQLAKPVVLFS